jgi:hypothetical protein
MVLPLIVVGGIALYGLAQAAVQPASADAIVEPDLPPEGSAPEQKEQPHIPAEPPTMPAPNRDIGICRLFVIDTVDNRLSYSGQRHIRSRYNIAAEWVREAVGDRIAYDPAITILPSALTAGEIREIVLYGDLPKEIFDWLENAFGGRYNPYDERLIGMNQTWQFIVRGAGGYAAGSHVSWNGQNIGWGIVGDAVLSSWLSEIGLETNIAPDVIFIGDCNKPSRGETHPDYEGPCMSRSEREGYGTPDAQTGSFIHETFHAMFGADHWGELNSIMQYWWNWPDNIIDAQTANLIPDSGYIFYA